MFVLFCCCTEFSFSNKFCSVNNAVQHTQNYMPQGYVTGQLCCLSCSNDFSQELKIVKLKRIHFVPRLEESKVS